MKTAEFLWKLCIDTLDVIWPVMCWQEFELDPESDTDQVDDLLSLCLKQALSQAKSTGKGDADTSTAAASD